MLEPRDEMIKKMQYHELSEHIVTIYFNKVKVALGNQGAGGESAFWDANSEIARQHSLVEALLRSWVLSKVHSNSARAAANAEEAGAVGILGLSLKRNLVLATNEYLKISRGSADDMSASAKTIVDTIERELERGISERGK